jgi:hypothetical protein
MIPSSGRAKRLFDDAERRLLWIATHRAPFNR